MAFPIYEPAGVSQSAQDHRGAGRHSVLRDVKRAVFGRRVHTSVLVAEDLLTYLISVVAVTQDRLFPHNSAAYHHGH